MPRHEFLIIVNHDIDRALPDRLFERAYRFFSQPFEEKLKVEKFEGRGPDGYHMFARQSNGLAYRNIQSKVDLLKIAPDLVDPVFIAEAAKVGAEIKPMDGKTLEALINDILGAPQELKDRVKAVLPPR